MSLTGTDFLKGSVRLLILNEVKEAEMILKDSSLSFCRIGKILNILIRYFVNNKGYSPEVAVKETADYLKSNRPGFNENQWRGVMESIANEAHKKPLRDIESVPITQAEIDKINELPTMPCRKVAFAYLVLAKVNYITYRHTWVNVSDAEMMTVADVHHNNDTYLNILNDLYTSGFITFAKSMLKTSIKVEFTDPDGEPKVDVTSLTHLGLWWEYINGAKYRFCVDCGMIFKPNSNNHIHCNKHVKSRICVCETCGRAFEIPEGGRKRKRCECCQREFKLKRKAEQMREYRAKKASNI